MQRVVILGPGGSGKSTIAAQIGKIAGLPVIELDKMFWRPDLTATPRDQWITVQQKLANADRWIMDGDLGPYDAVEGRLRAADTIIFLDFSTIRCAWRVLRRSQERVDFWMWLFRYRWHFRPLLMRDIARYAPAASLHLLRKPAEVKRFMAELSRDYDRRASRTCHA